VSHTPTGQLGNPTNLGEAREPPSLNLPILKTPRGQGYEEDERMDYELQLDAQDVDNLYDDNPEDGHFRL
jgi:hypothetical protein